MMDHAKQRLRRSVELFNIMDVAEYQGRNPCRWFLGNCSSIISQ